jgi:microcystin-dependent protein
MKNNIIYIILTIVIIYFIFFNKKNNKEIENFTASTDMVVFSDNDGNLISKDRNSVFTKGMILAWSGTIENIPSGWKLCDGNNETPNLRGRFILGLNPANNRENSLSIREKDQKDGFERVTLTVGQMPQHNHDIVGKGDDGGWCATGECGFWSTDRWSNDKEVRASKSNGKLVVENAGNNESHENMPPFYVLAYIMKT